MFPPLLPWHFRVCEALQEGDLERAQSVCDLMVRTGSYKPDHPIDRAVRALMDSIAGDRDQLAEVEASLARPDLPTDTRYGDDGRLAAYMIAGMLRTRDAPALAMGHFEGALRLSPGYLPARVELECLRRGLDRQALFGALGEAAPRGDWRYMLAASELGLEAGISPVPTSGAICIRGVCTPQTAALLRLYRWLNPGAPVILATWSNTPPEILESVRGLAAVVVADEPAVDGSQNKNRQITLARAAGLIARPHVDHILMVRTDLALFTPNILPSLYALNAAFPVNTPRMQERLVVCDAFTRRFRDYHVSDILSFGTTEDVLRYWSAPFEGPDAYAHTETYLGRHFMETVLGDVGEADDMRQYRRLLRDCFIIRDLDWLNGFWLRHPDMRNTAHLNFADACFSQRDWEQMYLAPHLHEQDLFLEAGIATRELLVGVAKGVV